MTFYDAPVLPDSKKPIPTMRRVHRGVFVASLFAMGLLFVDPTMADDIARANSETFSYRYEGGEPLRIRGDSINLGGGYFGTLGGATTESDGEILRCDTPIESGIMLRNPFWETDTDHAEGWTWEIRLKVDAGNAGRSFQVRLGDRGRGGSHIGLQFWSDRLQGFNGSVLARHDFTTMTTVRVAQAANSDEFVVWVDGEQLAVSLKTELLNDRDPHWTGDGSASAGGTTWIDYIRWTGLGGFAPGEPSVSVPEVEHAEINDNYVSRRRELPKFGLILNDDGDGSFPSSDPRKARAYRQAMVDAFAGTPVQTLMVAVGMGSDTLYYPTSVANAVGWRKTAYDEFHENPTSEEQMWAQRITNIRNGIAANVDPVRVVGERAHKHGMRFVPSYRMNDDHFMFDPLEYPMTGKFWLENHERMKIKDSPILGDPRYGQLLDFSHSQVRKFRRDILFEIIDRYADLMDGLELDFNRVQVFFPRGKAKERAHLMTQLVADVRRRLDEVEKRVGRDLYLFARVPPTLRHCEWAGLQIQRYVDRHLVDVLVPAQLMTLSHDMPIRGFVGIARRGGAQVYPALYPRTNWMWPLREERTKTDGAPVIRRVTPELYRGAASNYWAQGADGFQLFNFRTIVVPQPDIDYRVMRDLASPACLNQADKVFAVTPGYYLDDEDTYQSRKQLPVALKPGRLHKLTLLAHESFDAVDLPPSTRKLRIGLRGLPEDSGVTVSINGRALRATDGGPLKTADSGPATAPTHYLEFVLDASAPLRAGRNEVGVVASADGVEVVECQLGLFYPARPMAIFEP